MWAAGEPKSTIAKRLGCSHEALRKKAVSIGLQSRPVDKGPQPPQEITAHPDRVIAGLGAPLPPFHPISWNAIMAIQGKGFVEEWPTT